MLFSYWISEDYPGTPWREPLYCEFEEYLYSFVTSSVYHGSFESKTDHYVHHSWQFAQVELKLTQWHFQKIIDQGPVIKSLLNNFYFFCLSPCSIVTVRLVVPQCSGSFQVLKLIYNFVLLVALSRLWIDVLVGNSF